jgi:hypothetical protein
MNGCWRAVAFVPDKRDEWNSFAAGSRVPHFFFQRGYMEYHADRFEDASLLVYEDARLRALLPANRDGDVVRSHGGLTFGGFITDSAMTVHAMVDTFECCLGALRATGANSLVYAPAPHIYHEVPAEEDLYVLVRLGARLVRRDLSSAIACGSRPRPAKGRRSSTKRALEAGLAVERSWSFDEFMALEASVLTERHGVTPTHSGDEIALLAQRFPDSIKLFVASERSRWLGGMLVYETSRVAHAQYIAATEEGRQCGAVDAIVAYLLEGVYRTKPFFDFGISTERDGRDLNQGLVRNKESYGARGVVYDRYEVRL